MSIVIKCITCGKVLADKYRLYLNEVNKLKGDNIQTVEYFNLTNIHKTPEAIVMDELHLDCVGCRRHMLTHVETE